MMEDVQVEWALVCSVDDASKEAELVEFAKWLMVELARVGKDMGVFIGTQPDPSYVTTIPVKDINGMIAAYEQMGARRTIQMVLHVLPHENSVEYGWMKSLSEQFGIIRQGVLLHNALLRFPNLNLDDVLRNMAQWMVRRSHEISHGKARQRPFELRIGGNRLEGDVQRTTTNSQLLVSAVNVVLHSSVCTSNDENSVCVSGLPIGVNEFAVASIFRDLTVISVVLSTSEAIVCLANKFHAFQAVHEYNNTIFDKYHRLRISPLGQTVSNQLEARF